jgi:dihydrofolate synthase/folylpolyglutamate synthase
MLTSAGYKTGLALSPHIVRINERIQLNGKEIGDEDFAKLVTDVIPAVEKMKQSMYGSPSYFEITVGMTFLFFARQQVDIAVVEVGMGGKYDATNTLEPLVAVLTNVSLDHIQFLGDTVEEIAKTKVGIIKKYNVSSIKYKGENTPVVVTGVTQSSVIEVVEKRCKEVGTKLYRLGKDFQLTGYEIGLHGEYQRENASLAIEAIKQLGKLGFSIDEQTIREALHSAHFTGRFELIEYVVHNTKYKILLDGAHNQAKMHAFVSSLRKAYPTQKKIFVISFKKDKNIEEMVKEIITQTDSIVITEFEIGTDTMISKASMDAESIADIIKELDYKKEIYNEKDSVKAVKKAMHMAKEDDIVVITGSLYLIGEIKQRFFKEEQ